MLSPAQTIKSIIGPATLSQIKAHNFCDTSHGVMFDIDSATETLSICVHHHSNGLHTVTMGRIERQRWTSTARFVDVPGPGLSTLIAAAGDVPPRSSGALTTSQPT